MDFKAIATALATTIGTVTAGGVTLTATARLPDTIGQAALLVYPPEGPFEYEPGPRVDVHLLFPVRFLYDPPAGVPDRSDLLLDWMTALWSRPQSDYDLGLAGVMETKADSIRGAIDGHQYGSIDGTFARFDLVELMVDVHVNELATFT